MLLIITCWCTYFSEGIIYLYRTFFRRRDKIYPRRVEGKFRQATHHYTKRQALKGDEERFRFSVFSSKCSIMPEECLRQLENSFPHLELNIHSSEGVKGRKIKFNCRRHWNLVEGNYSHQGHSSGIMAALEERTLNLNFSSPSFNACLLV